MARFRTSNGSEKSSASLGFEAKLWLAADKLRNNMDAAETINATPVVLPPADVLQAFEGRVTPFFAQIRANFLQFRTLATLRDTLLPKLLSGELSTRESNANAGAVL